MENLLIKNELIAISDRLGHLTSEALRANTLFQLVAVGQQGAKSSEKVEYAAVIRLLKNPVTDLGLSKEEIDLIKGLLTGIIGKEELDAPAFM